MIQDSTIMEFEAGHVAQRIRDAGESQRLASSHADAAAARVIRLTGDSALQFISLAVPRHALEGTRRLFAEDAPGTDESILQTFQSERDVPEDLQATVVRIRGDEAADALADQWLPMPCLRGAKRSEVDFETAVAGPTNWARMRLVRDGTSFRLVLAFDTRLADPARGAGRADLAPTLDDVRHGVLFSFARDLADIETLISEPWADDWIGGTPMSDDHPGAELPNVSSGSLPRGLRPIAHYLTLLAALDAAGKLPHVEIVGSAIGRLGTSDPARACDLAISFADGMFDAHIVDCARFQIGDTAAIAEVAFRDLDRPWVVHRGTARSALTFARPSMGNDVLSRQSGRTDAFVWPSFARIGAEAQVLATQQPVDGPQSGCSDTLGHLFEETPNDTVWRFARAQPSGRLPFVSGPLLAHVTEVGERVAVGAGRTGATRARFTPSSLLTFSVHELFLQALATAAAADLSAPHEVTAPARIGRVIVALPDHLHAAELEIAERRIEDGVALACDALAWPQETRPTVIFSRSRTRALTYAFLHNEIAHRFAGRASGYLQLLAGPMRPAGAEVRVAALDVSRRAIALDITSVATRPDAPLALSQNLADSASIGTDDIAARLIERLIVPALAQHLAKARLTDARAFLARNVTPRLMRDTLMPAARALMLKHKSAALGAQDIATETALRSLLGPTHDAIAVTKLQDLAMAEGANAVTLLDAPITSTQADVQSTSESVLGPALRAAARTLRRTQCNLVLLAGDPATISLARAVMHAEAAVPPDRIVDMTRYRFGSWAGSDLPAARHAGLLVGVSQPEEADPRTQPRVVAMDLDGSTVAVFAPGGDTSQVVTFTGEPLALGLSRLASAGWPPRPLARLDIAAHEVLGKHALPFKVTLALDPGRISYANALAIRDIRDARGRELPPTVLHLEALPAETRTAVPQSESAGRMDRGLP